MLIMVEPTNHMISCDFIEGPTKRSTNSAILLLSPVVSQDLVRISAPRSNTTRSVKYCGITSLTGTMPNMEQTTIGRNAVTATPTGMVIHHADIQRNRPSVPRTANGRTLSGISSMQSANRTGPDRSFATDFLFICDLLFFIKSCHQAHSTQNNRKPVALFDRKLAVDFGLKGAYGLGNDRFA